MQITEKYVTDRLLPSYVAAACKKRGISYKSYSGDWILRLHKNTLTHWVYGYSFSCNSATAAANTSDKVATHLILSDNNLPSVAHILARTVTGTSLSSEDVKQLGNLPVVIKPLHGTGGLDVMLFVNIQKAASFITASSQPSWAISPFIEIEKEVRVVILEKEVLLMYEKQQPFVRQGLKLFNLSHGAKAFTLEADATAAPIIALAKETMLALNLTLGAIDIVIDEQGKMRILEVNSGFSLERYARQSSENNNRAMNFYDTIVDYLFH